MEIKTQSSRQVDNIMATEGTLTFTGDVTRREGELSEVTGNISNPEGNAVYLNYNEDTTNLSGNSQMIADTATTSFVNTLIAQIKSM